MDSSPYSRKSSKPNYVRVLLNKDKLRSRYFDRVMKINFLLESSDDMTIDMVKELSKLEVE